MERDPMEMALSTDVIMDIVLRHLTVRDLLSCRLASKFWNKAASAVLRKRATMMKNISDEDDLMELKECIKQSSDFPFAGLKLDKPWRFNSSRAVEFFQKYGDRFTRLRLDTRWVIRLHLIAPFINHLRRLSILEVGGYHSSSLPAELLDSDVGQEDDQILELKSVQTVRICFPCPEVNEDIIREVLTAASPSLRIECLDGWIGFKAHSDRVTKYLFFLECLDATPEILRALKRAGKLRAITYIKFEPKCSNPKAQLEMEQLLSTESLSVTKLDFDVCGYLSRHGLQRILFSSQNTLKEMYLDGICLLDYSWDEFPVFTKLTKLRLRDVEHDAICEPLCHGTHGHKFPALKELRLEILSARFDTLRAFLPDGLLVVPSVAKIYLEWYVSESGMKMLARWFPDVIEMRLEYEFYSGDFSPPNGCDNPFEMWNVREFKRLEKLIIWDYVVAEWLQPRHYISMDRFLTGIPFEICENLRKHERLDLVNSPFNALLRYNPSILQLRNLKELVVCVKPGCEVKETTEETPFISMVSVWYALEMMPSLRVKFVYEEYPDNPTYSIAERDKAMLKAAFKHVQPSIKLEPFVY